MIHTCQVLQLTRLLLLRLIQLLLQHLQHLLQRPPLHRLLLLQQHRQQLHLLH